jgi:hypothetical protein
VVGTNKKIKYATVAFLLFFCLVTIAYATYSIYSNTITITVSQYILTANADNTSVALYNIVNLSGALHLGNNPVQGATITLYQSDDPLSWLAVNNTLTDSNGVYTFLQNMTTTGTLYLRTEYRAQ